MTKTGLPRILIVDDDRSLSTSLELLFKDEELDVRTAISGEEAILELTRNSYDLVLLDIVMSGMGGHEVLRHIKHRYPKTAVIMLTGHATLESAIEALRDGAYDYIRKPCQYEELMNRVRNALLQHRLEGENRVIQYELDESRQRYEYLVQSSPDLIYVLDGEGVFSFINEAFERLLGYKPCEIIGKHYSCLVYPSDLDRSRYAFNERRTGERATLGKELRLKGNTNGPIDFELTAHGIYADDAKKRYLGTHGIARDIRERKLLEAHLQQAQKMEAIERLAGGIAHDFNNILTAILGNIELIKMQLDQQDRNSNRIGEIEKASHRARNLTQQLITFARGGTPVKNIGSLSDLVRDVASFNLSGSNVSCRFRIADDLWSVEFDEGQIGQVIQNLVINADQSMPDGGTIDIEADNIMVTPLSSLPLAQGKHVKISVRDRGCGIPREQLNKIFDPFFTTKDHGTGLGLATSYSIMKKHGGFINADSVEGSGSAFTLYLPASDRAKPREPDDSETICRGHGRILVMDDEQDLLEIYSRMLRILGYEPVLVADGKDALSRYKQAGETGRPFDAVIMDLTIRGGMGGRETIRHLLEYDTTARVIVSSGYSSDSVLANHKKHGFKDIIVKPFNIHNLSQALHRVLTQGCGSHPDMQ